MAEQGAAAAVEFARTHGSKIAALSVAQPYPLMAAAAAGVIDSASESRFLLDPAQQHVDKVAHMAKAAGVARNGAVAAAADRASSSSWRRTRRAASAGSWPAT